MYVKILCKIMQSIPIMAGINHTKNLHTFN